MQSESSGRRRNDENIVRPKLEFSWIFYVLVTSYLEFSPGLKIQCQSDPEPPPGRKSRQEIEIGSETTSKPTKNWENEKIEKNSRKLQDSSILHLQICIFAPGLRAPPRYNDLLRQQKGKFILYLKRFLSSRLWFATSVRRKLILLYSNKTWTTWLNFSQKRVRSTLWIKNNIYN